MNAQQRPDKRMDVSGRMSYRSSGPPKGGGTRASGIAVNSAVRCSEGPHVQDFREL